MKAPPSDLADFESSGNCVHCGLCIASCPTYLELGTEMDSPRGRIQLMRSLRDGTVPLDGVSVRHLDLCLGCRACETACPSGVRYGSLIEGARAFIDSRHRRSWPERMKRGLLNRALPNPAIMRTFGWAARWMTRLGLRRLARTRFLPASFRRSLRYLPGPEAPFRSVRLPAVTPPAKPVQLGTPARPDSTGRISAMSTPPAHAQPGTPARPDTAVRPSEVTPPIAPAQRRTDVLASPWNSSAAPPTAGPAHRRVGLLAGCVMQSLFGGTHVSTMQLLTQHGCEVRVPPEAGCCGALPLHNGDRERGLALARRTIAAFDGLNVDAVLSNAAGCGAAMREYGAHFQDDAAWRARAERVAARVRDVAEFLHGLPDFAPAGRVDARVAYHDACHLLNGQGVEAQPRELLKNVAGVQWVDLHEAEVCCGSAGTYNLTEPELAGRLAARKAENVIATGADVLVTGNPGCIVQIRAALRERGSSIRVMHTADFLAEACAEGSAPSQYRVSNKTA